MQKLVTSSMWIAYLLAVFQLVSCANSQEISSETPEVKTSNREKQVTAQQFTESYHCSCPSGNMPPPLRDRADNNLYFNAIHSQLETSTIKGKVVGEMNEPVPFAIVSLNNTTIASMTDEEGNYELSGIPDGPIQLMIRSDNHCGCFLPIYTIDSPQLFTAATIHLSIVRAQVLKPIIYLYPEVAKDVTVRLDYAGKITHSYPHYTGLWKVHAETDGTLTDSTGRSYYALFWEGTPEKTLSIPDGFLVKSTETIPFLESALDRLGLTEREANEFIMFWYPKMEENPYNLVHFSFEEYIASANLEITPAPETVIRVMMVYQGLSEPIDFPLQLLPERPERKGFTVVEWGGTEVNELLN